MELALDFSAHLPEHLTPSYNKVVSLLTQTVSEFQKGSVMLIKERKGLFIIRVWDKTKGEKPTGIKRLTTIMMRGNPKKKSL